jgi:hypothetical protein
MADQVSRKFVVIRKKAAEPKPEAEQLRGVEGTAAQQSGGPSEKRKARRKSRLARWEKSHPGLQHVQFAIDIELWNRFVARCCATRRLNDVFTRMIREAVECSEAIEEILTRDKPRWVSAYAKAFQAQKSTTV